MWSSLILLFLQLWGIVHYVYSSQDAPCSSLPNVPHASVSDTHVKTEYSRGDVIHFTCEIGYISGPTIRYICSDDGWTPLFKAMCYLKPCELPDDTPNGQFHIIHGEDFVFGTTIKYTCNEGYQMVSKEDTRTCLLDKWTNHVPICDPLTCDPPPEDEWLTVKGVPENGDPVLPDRFLTFSCDVPGKYLNGSSMLICGKDGKWNNPFPSCEDITCKVDVMHQHLIVNGQQPANQTVKIGQKLQFHCDNNFVLEGLERIECLENGQWNAPFPTCTEKCKVRPVPRNVYTITRVRGNHVRRGEKLKFHCHSSREFLRGNAEIECLLGGQWSGPVPTCGDPVGCEKPPTLQDGDTEETLKYEYSHGESVRYVCQNLYTMQGNPVRTCYNGQWTGQMKCLQPCTVDRERMKSHNIVFRYTGEQKLYSRHNDEIEFMCSGQTRHDGATAMRQRCLDGVMTMPTCH